MNKPTHPSFRYRGKQGYIFLLTVTDESPLFRISVKIYTEYEHSLEIITITEYTLRSGDIEEAVTAAKATADSVNFSLSDIS